MHTRVSLHLLREKIRYTRTQPTPGRYKWRRPHSPQPQRRSLSEIFAMVLLRVPQTPYTNTSNQMGFIPRVLVQYHLQESQQPGIRLHMALETDIACNLVDAQSTTFNDFPGTKASFRLGVCHRLPLSTLRRMMLISNGSVAWLRHAVHTPGRYNECK